MKISIVVAITSLVVVVDFAHAECCRRTKMYWKAPSCEPYKNDFDVSIDPYGNLANRVANAVANKCQATVCGDGREHKGFFCGKGRCNVFGCDCDGGCHKGNAEENFRKISGVSSAIGGSSPYDITTWGK